MSAKERLEQSLKEMKEMRKVDTDDGVYVDGKKEGGVEEPILPIIAGNEILKYYDEGELKQLNKENLKSIIKEILEEDIRTMPNCNGVEI